jgi:hypothetical protein
MPFSDHELLMQLCAAVDTLAAAAKVEAPTFVDSEGKRYRVAPGASHLVVVEDAESETQAKG